MAGPVLYSANPWVAHEISMRYLDGKHFVWCSEYYDPSTAPPGSAQSAIAPSSSPKGIYDALHGDCYREDRHSSLIKRYKGTFCRLAKNWLADSLITAEQHNEIVSTVRSPSWRIWRPVLYVIPKAPIEAADRLKSVANKHRAAYGPELQIVDLMQQEFDIIER